MRTSSQTLICSITGSILRGAVALCIENKRISVTAPVGSFRCCRISLSKTNHLQPDRRRLFYLALLNSYPPQTATDT